MKKCVIYARYSSDRQTEQSIEGQLHVCQEFAKRNDIIIVAQYIDRAMTGTNDKREEFQRMLKDSDKHPWDYVLIYKLDRFSRNKYEMAIHRKHLKDNGIKILSAMENIPDTPEGILLESLLEGINQYYSEELSQKTKRGMHETRMKGHFIGGFINYGYSLSPIFTENNGKKVKIGDFVIVNETESDIVNEIFFDYANGMKVVDIVRQLNGNNILNRGKPFLESTVYNILRQEKYTGVYKINDMEYTNIYPQIVPNDIFEIVHKKIVANRHGKHVPDVSYILRNYIFCGYCGKKITSFTGTSKSGKIWRYYKCYNRKKCNGASIRKDVIENAVVNTLRMLISSDKQLEILTKSILRVYNKRIENDIATRSLEKELSTVKKSLDNIMKAIEAGIFTDTTKERLQELELRRSVLENQIQLARLKTKDCLTVEKIQKHLQSAINVSDEQLVELLIDHIELFNDKIEITLKYTKDHTNDYPQKRKRKKHTDKNEQFPDRESLDQGIVLYENNYTYEMRKPGRIPISEIIETVKHVILVRILV